MVMKAAKVVVVLALAQVQRSFTTWNSHEPASKGLQSAHQRAAEFVLNCCRRTGAVNTSDGAVLDCQSVHSTLTHEIKCDNTTYYMFASLCPGPVQYVAMALEGVDNIYGCDSLAVRELHVCHCIADIHNPAANQTANCLLPAHQ